MHLPITFISGVCLLATAAATTPTNTAVVGDVRVTAISPVLVRVEPRGPRGFEDRTTFMVVNRAFDTVVPITNRGTTAQGFTRLSTPFYDVLVNGNAAGDWAVLAPGGGGAGAPGDVLYNATRDAPPAPNAGCAALTPAQCGNGAAVTADRCFFLKDCKECRDLATPRANLLHWPSPLAQRAYALEDRPRFFVPAWGPAPPPKGATVDPRLAATNGYDFTNDVGGDTYVFLLGATLGAWNAARKAFVALAGPTPALPDFAFGTWFTRWHQYTEAEAKAEVANWTSQGLPLDIWALDMNWRNTSEVTLPDGTSIRQDRYYDHPAIPNLFSNFTDWFAYLRGLGLRTYFNDHPFPVASRDAGGLQTSPSEVAFRWHGLAEWMARGLTYWWFDHNWGFSIPPPFVNSSETSRDWRGLDNAAWGSHVYHESAAQFDARFRAGDRAWYGAPLSLTKFQLADWRAGMPHIAAQESPAQHRFGVWWTGDGVRLRGSVQTMVDAGVHGFKPYVHSDCGGDGAGGEHGGTRGAGDLLRWTAHCAYGTVFRYHGADHRPWIFGPAVEGTIRDYLKARYRLAPSLVAAGHEAAATGAPFVTRGDLLWPALAGAGAGSNDQPVEILRNHFFRSERRCIAHSDGLGSSFLRRSALLLSLTGTSS